MAKHLVDISVTETTRDNGSKTVSIVSQDLGLKAEVNVFEHTPVNKTRVLNSLQSKSFKGAGSHKGLRVIDNRIADTFRKTWGV